MLEKVSILLICYNHASYIRETLLSVVSQDYASLEIVVADDGSQDGSHDIISTVASKDSRIVPLLSPVNHGSSSNWNHGIRRCTGDFIALMSGDDLMMPGKISRQIAFMRANPDCGISTHDMTVFDSASQKELYSTRDRYRSHDGGPETLFATNWLMRSPIKSIPSSTMVRAEFLSNHRMDRRLKFRNEWLHLIDCMAHSHYRWKHLPEIMGRYRVHSGQAHTSKEASGLSFEEAMMVLAIASARYPHLSGWIKSKRDFMLFEHILLNWHKEGLNSQYEEQLKNEAGICVWLYLKCCQIYLDHRNALKPLLYWRKNSWHE